MKNEDQVRKKRKLRRDDEDGETSEQEDASLNEEDKKKDAPAGDESDKKELPKKDGPAVPMATMMFPMTMMMPMMMPYPQGAVGAGATDEIPKKKKRGRPSKKSLAQQSTPTLNPADQSVPMPMWPFGMPLMPGAKDQESTASSLLTKAGTVEEQSALKEVVDDMKKKVRSTTGKPRGRPRTRPRPGDIITRPKLMNLAPAVIYDHMNGAHLDKDAKESGAEDDDDEEPHKSGERVV
ncbi:hypothetical protein AC1031_017669 [Aphanomyces cochlioides]|nr:hypothetical protein AC1031_017669 [Aphanomyces cochlioides]